MTELDRCKVLRAGLVAGAGVVGGGLLGAAGAAAAPAWRPAGRPVLTHGVQSGDATADSALVWTRADRPGRMLLEVSRRPDFRGARRLTGPVLDPSGDTTGKVRLRGLPSGERLHYLVRVESRTSAACRSSGPCEPPVPTSTCAAGTRSMRTAR